MTLQEAIAAYEERFRKFGVSLPGGGRCISEDHTGHNHGEEEQ